MSLERGDNNDLGGAVRPTPRFILALGFYAVGGGLMGYAIGFYSIGIAGVIVAGAYLLGGLPALLLLLVEDRRTGRRTSKKN